MTRPTVSDAARARGVLFHTLRGAIDAGEGVPCMHPARGPLWTSEDPEDLADAAAACGPCPALAACWEAGRSEPWGVWGGVVRGLPKTATTKARTGLPPRSATVLLAVATSPTDATLTAVADATGIRRAGTAEALRTLAEAGLLARTGRRHSMVYTVTDAGLSAAEAELSTDPPLGAFAEAKRDRSLTPLAGVTDT